MTELGGLIETDRLATLSINGSDSLFWDGVAGLYTTVIIWIPLAITAIYILINNIPPKKLLLVLLMLVVTIVLCDQLSSSVFKPLVHRLRPTRDPYILDMIDTVNGYRGGLYGFFSGHAANSFGIVTFFIWLVRDKWFSISVLIWATANSLIRTYLGVHFLGDIIVGAIVGVLIGSLSYWIYYLIANRDKGLSYKKRYSSILHTESGFMRRDVFLFLGVLFGTYSVILIGGCWVN